MPTTRNQITSFSYTPDGFCYNYDKQIEKVKWVDISKIVAYKADLLTFDEIRLQIFYEDWQLIITEDAEDWGKLLSRLKAIFPQIPKDWEYQVSQPPFATNLTVLYENNYINVFADFNNADERGRVRLNTNGSINDIKNIGSDFHEDIYVLLDSKEELQIFGLIKYSVEENIWVAEIDWNNFIRTDNSESSFS